MKSRARRYLVSAAVIIAIIAVCFLVAYAATLSQVEFADARITRITPAQNGFLVQGEYGVRNNGLFTVELQEITYTLTLKETGESLGEGTLPGTVLPPDVTTKLDATIPVVWTPTAQSLATLYGKGSATIVLDGKAHVTAGPFTVTSPFTTNINATKYVQDYAQAQQETFLRQLGLGN